MAVRKHDKQAVMRAMRRAGLPPASPRLPTVIALTDSRRLPDPEEALGLLPEGAALIWRAYGEDPGSRIAGIVRHARRRGVMLLLAGDERAAARLGVGGRHLPEHMINRPGTDGCYAHPRRPRPGFIVTAAAHSEIAVIRAARAGADAVLISPVLPTESHPGAPSLGTVRFARLAHLAQSLGLASYALGGIASAASIRRLSNSGAAGVAGIGIFKSEDQA